jgi:hypothetical protein
MQLSLLLLAKFNHGMEWYTTKENQSHNAPPIQTHHPSHPS